MWWPQSHILQNPFTDDLPMFFSGPSQLLFSTLPLIICLSSSKQAEHTICHSALCLYIPSQFWTLYVRDESSVEEWCRIVGVGQVLSMRYKEYQQARISVSIHCEYTKVRFSQCTCTSKHVLSGKDIILSPVQVTLLSQQWLTVFNYCISCENKSQS